MSEDLLTVLQGQLIAPRENADGRQRAVARVEVLEPHPVRETAGHEVDRLEDLQRPDLLNHEPAVEVRRAAGLVWPHAAHKVWLGVHEGAQQIVQPRVEVLRQGRHGLVAVQELRVGRRRDAERDAARNRLLGVQRLDLRPEQVGHEPETAVLFVEDRDQVVGDDVTVRV